MMRLACTFLLSGCLLLGCGSKRPFVFMGLAETESSNEGVIGPIDGRYTMIDDVTEVKAATYRDYLTAKSAGRIVAATVHNGYQYWAVKEERDVQFDVESIPVEVTHRFKAKLP